MISLYNFSVLALVYCYVMLFYFKHGRFYLKLLVYFIRKHCVAFRKQQLQLFLIQHMIDDGDRKTRKVLISLAFALFSLVLLDNNLFHFRFSRNYSCKRRFGFIDSHIIDCYLITCEQICLTLASKIPLSKKGDLLNQIIYLQVKLSDLPGLCINSLLTGFHICQKKSNQSILVHAIQLFSCKLFHVLIIPVSKKQKKPCGSFAHRYR